MVLKQRLGLAFIRSKFAVLSFLSPDVAGAAAFRLFCTPRRKRSELATESCPQYEEILFQQAHFQIRGYRWNAGANRKVLILHGWESSALRFCHLVPYLVNAHFEVTAFDAPAHGKSSGQMVMIPDYVRMITYVQTNYGPFDTFIAHSLGGLALSLALEAMPHDAKTKIVLIAPATETTTAARQLFELIALKPRAIASFYTYVEKTADHELAWFSLNRAAKNIKAQVLFLQDRKDELTPYKDVVQLIGQNLPNFRYHITEGLGHSRIYRDEETIKEIIEFL